MAKDINMKNIWTKYVESWKFAIEFLLRFDSQYANYSGKDWIKGSLLVVFHLISICIVWIFFLQVVTGQ